MGTFAGVFTPSILTILGIILFLRLGFVVGEAGLGRALLIIALANAITVLTSLSLSAIATNLKVKGGGDYYLISRTLGPAFGGALGLVLFLAQSVSIAFYCIGFGEGLAGILPPAWALSPRLAAAVAVTGLFALSWLGADWATRFQYGVMGLLAAALVSFYLGAFAQWDGARLASGWSAPGGGMSFWTLFAIFFPAVTGFTQGVSMSGDLADPGRSLPLGTFLAVGLSILVYFSVALMFAGASPAETLRMDYNAMRRVARVGGLVDAGVVAATLSSAMASFLGGPRILQSLAADRLFGFLGPFAQGAGPSANPRRAVLLSAAIAYATVALGNLNLIAPVVSMFFLISYGLLNYATYFEARAASPSFRPRFRWFHPKLSLIGAVACLVVMLGVDWMSSIAAVSILFAILQYVNRTSGPARWADSRRSYHLQQVRAHLLAAAAEPDHDRDWRPQILAFSNQPERRQRLLALAGWMEGGSGLTTILRIIEGRGAKVVQTGQVALEELRRDIAAGGFQAFPEVVTTSDVEAGLGAIVQTAGIGPFKANLVLVNWIDPDQPKAQGFQALLFGRHLRAAFRQERHVAVLSSNRAKWERTVGPADAPARHIAVWWRNDATGRLMLLLAYLMTRHADWEGAPIRVLAAGMPGAGGETDAEEALTRLLDEYRIEAAPVILPSAAWADVGEALQAAALLLIPFRFSANRIRLPWEHPLDDILAFCPTTVMVAAARDVDLDAAPEEGRAAEMATARDKLEDRRKRVALAEREAAQSARAVAQARERLAHFLDAQTEAIELAAKEALDQAVAETEQAAEKARRRAGKAAAKLKQAEAEARTLGLPPETNPEDPSPDEA